MAAPTKSKEIQVQKPAQSLQAFQQKLASGEDTHGTLLKPLLIGAGIVAALVIGFFGYRAWRSSVLEKHETALASLLLEVNGDGLAPVAPPELEKRMREHLPQLEALAQSAPREVRDGARGLLASWHLQLDGKNTPVTGGTDPWSRLRLAQRHLALGQADDAAAILKSLQRSAKPDEPWAPLFWVTMLDLHRLKGDRDQAWKDFAEYKTLFKERVDPGFEKALASI